MKMRLHKKRKGYAIIELITVFALITIIFSYEFIGMKKYNSNLNKIDLDYCCNSIMLLINNSRQYCKEKNVSGYIVFDIAAEDVWFYCQGVKIEKYQLPSKMKLVSMNAPGSKINIDKYGTTTSDCTISIRDEEGIIHLITMCVGTSYVEIKP